MFFLVHSWKSFVFVFIFDVAFHHIFIRIHSFTLVRCHKNYFNFVSDWLTSMLTKMTHGFSFIGIISAVQIRIFLFLIFQRIIWCSLLSHVIPSIFDAWIWFRFFQKGIIFFPVTVNSHISYLIWMYVCICVPIQYHCNYISIGGNDQRHARIAPLNKTRIQSALKHNHSQEMHDKNSRKRFDIREKSRIKMK